MKNLISCPDLINVEKPARYTNNEWNIRKKEIFDKDCRFALAFPDCYEIAQSGVGIKILYDIINNYQRAFAERVFAPLPDMENMLRKKGIYLSSLESKQPLKEFDIIGFSLQYQMTYTNVLNMLDLSGIPAYSENREVNFPLIIAGGPAIFNPEPIADFFDAILLGDGEELVIDFIETYLKWKDDGGNNKKELLRNLCKIEGVYIPSLYKVSYNSNNTINSIKVKSSQVPVKIRKRVVKDLNKTLFPASPVVPYIQTVHDRITLEIFRGCTKGCRFCQAGFIYRPVRERTEKNILDLAEKSIKNTGYDEISLLSLSCTDYSKIGDLLKNLTKRYTKKGISISLPSLRMDSSAVNLAKIIETPRKRGLTFAPEAGTQRLRNVINKNITEEDIFNTLKEAKKLGWNQIKLYFMIGLPTENDEDIDGIIRLVHTIVRQLKIKLHVSISHFVPQPFTPFQWEKMETIKSLTKKAYYLKDHLKHKKIRFNWHDCETSFLEGVFTRGDRRLSKVIYNAFKQGCRFDSWSEYFDFQKWMDAFKESCINPEEYLRERSVDEILPWSHIEAGISTKYLIEERIKAYKEELTGDCREFCNNCGVCPLFKTSNIFSPDKNIEIDPLESFSNSINIHDRVMKLRIRLSKEGPCRWVSHLDFHRCFERGLRRASLPISYTEGFHPRPRISFYMPLPLGYESKSEWVEVILFKKEKIEFFIDKLNKHLPVNLKALEIKEVSLDEKSLSKNLFKGIFKVDFPINLDITRDEIIEKIKSYLIKDEIILNRKGKQRNIRDLIKKIDYLEKEGKKGLLLEIVYTPAGSVKPGEILSMLFDNNLSNNCHYTRKKLFVYKKSRWVSP